MSEWIKENLSGIRKYFQSSTLGKWMVDQNVGTIIVSSLQRESASYYRCSVFVLHFF